MPARCSRSRSAARSVSHEPAERTTSAQLYASGSLSELSLGAVAVSYAAIAMQVRRRGSVAATIAAAHVTRDAAARIVTANFNSPPGQVFTYVYGFGEFVAPIIMGIALWRSRRVPRWLAAEPAAPDSTDHDAIAIA
jgi:hypothetical protein